MDDITWEFKIVVKTNVERGQPSQKDMRNMQRALEQTFKKLFDQYGCVYEIDEDKTGMTSNE